MKCVLSSWMEEDQDTKLYLPPSHLSWIALLHACKQFTGHLYQPALWIELPGGLIPISHSGNYSHITLYGTLKKRFLPILYDLCLPIITYPIFYTGTQINHLYYGLFYKTKMTKASTKRPNSSTMWLYNFWFLDYNTWGYLLNPSF